MQFFARTYSSSTAAVRDCCCTRTYVFYVCMLRTYHIRGYLLAHTAAIDATRYYLVVDLLVERFTFVLFCFDCIIVCLCLKLTWILKR